MSDFSAYMKIAITKLREKSEGIHELFARYGHEAFIVSTMQASEPTDTGPLMLLCDRISNGKIDILIFTSALGVEKLFNKVNPGKNVRIVSVGPKTARKVEEFGSSSEVIHSFSSGNFAEYLRDIKGKNIGIARAEVPNLELTESLRAKGASVIEAPVYGLKPAGNDLIRILKDMDAVIFTSARSFESSGFDKHHPKNIKLIAIGQKTADAMRKRGIDPDLVGNGTLDDCLSRIS